LPCEKGHQEADLIVDGISFATDCGLLAYSDLPTATALLNSRYRGDVGHASALPKNRTASTGYSKVSLRNLHFMEKQGL
jgi:hypothetical protein